MQGIFTGLLLSVMMIETRCYETQGCENHPADWTDSSGRTCDDYRDLCISSRDHIMNWHLHNDYPAAYGKPRHRASAAPCVAAVRMIVMIMLMMFSLMVMAMAMMTTTTMKRRRRRLSRRWRPALGLAAAGLSCPG